MYSFYNLAASIIQQIEAQVKELRDCGPIEWKMSTFSFSEIYEVLSFQEPRSIQYGTWIEPIIASDRDAPPQ